MSTKTDEMVSLGVASVEIEIEGITQLVMHNGRTANPLDKYAKAMKAITGKRKKTDEDLEELARIEWEASLYVRDGKVVVPATVLEGALTEAGRKLRRGTDVRAGLWVEGVPLLGFPGSDRSLAELAEDDNHRLTCRVGVNGSTVVRTRAVFPEWWLNFTITYMTEIFNEADVVGIVRVLGRFVGLSDDRMKHGGRFKVLNPDA